MEKRVAGIIRWLERCIKAYKAGAVESALMDAECAKADMEALRSELWKKVETCQSAPARRFNFFKVAEAFFWAFGIMLISATPLALQQDGPAREARAEGNLTLEWVTPDERALLSNLRKSPSEPLAQIITPELAIADSFVAPAVPARSAGPERHRSPGSPPLRSEQTGQREPETSLPYDRILSLIEMGGRAMKNETPAIRVEITNEGYSTAFR